MAPLPDLVLPQNFECLSCGSDDVRIEYHLGRPRLSCSRCGLAVMPSLYERQVRGIQAQVQAAINQSTDGAEVHMDLTTARRVIEACEQLRRYERNFENP